MRFMIKNLDLTLKVIVASQMAEENRYQVCILGSYISGVDVDLQEDVMGTCLEASPVTEKSSSLSFVFFLFCCFSS